LLKGKAKARWTGFWWFIWAGRGITLHKILTYRLRVKRLKIKIHVEGSVSKDKKTYKITEQTGRFVAVIRDKNVETSKPIRGEVVKAARKVLTEHRQAWKDLA